jgi:hypothetical protein
LTHALVDLVFCLIAQVLEWDTRNHIKQEPRLDVRKGNGRGSELDVLICGFIGTYEVDHNIDKEQRID